MVQMLLKHSPLRYSESILRPPSSARDDEVLAFICVVFTDTGI